jgi:galactoside O-acetyltransferase
LPLTADRISLRHRLIRATRLLAPAALCSGVDRSAIVNFRRIRPASGVRLTIGDQSIVHAQILFDRDNASLDIGSRTFIGAGRIVVGHSVSIGSDVLISWGFTIVDHDSHAQDFEVRKNDVLEWRYGRKSWDGIASAPVRIENAAWIGFEAVILKGVTVGEGAIVAARAVVTRDVAPWTVVAGNPARVIKSLRPDAATVLDATAATEAGEAVRSRDDVAE